MKFDKPFAAGKVVYRYEYPTYDYDHRSDFHIYMYANLLAANGLSKPFADGKSTEDSRFSIAAGCSHLEVTP